MFERLIDENDVVTAALCCMDKSDLVLTPSDVLILKDALALLAPFEETTREISGETFISISKIIPMARSLQLMISKSTSTRPLKLELIEQMRQRFTNMEGNLLLSLSTLLDPRFKKLGFVDSNKYKEAVQYLTGEIGNLVELDEPTITHWFWAALDEKVATSRSTTVTASATVLVRSFLDQHNITRTDNPLTWWSNMSKSFSMLVPIAKQYLAIPGTSVPSERLFSKAGELISAKRASVKSKNVELILFLNKSL